MSEDISTNSSEMAGNGHPDFLAEPNNAEDEAWRQFMEEDDDMLPSIIRIDSADIVYEDNNPHASFIGERDQYMKGELLGEGSYSKVKEVLDMESLCRRAVKIVKWRNIRKMPNGIANVIREIKILKRLSHKNVISLIDDFFNEAKQKKYIVLDYCCCNLQAMLDEAEAKMFPEWQAHYYFTQLIHGIEYLHSRGIIHKDIKPANLLLTIDQVLKITDFGVSEELNRFAKDDTVSTSQATPMSQSPEIAAGDETFSGYKIDIWSCGITLYRMCTTFYPFDGDTIIKLYDNIAKAEYAMPVEWADSLKSIISGMLKQLGSERSTIEQIKNERWFKEQKPLVGEAVRMPAEEGNMAFTMTTLPHLKALVAVEANRCSAVYDSNESDNEVIMDSTECYTIPSTNVTTHNQDGAGEALGSDAPVNNQSNHNSVGGPTHRKHKKCVVS